MDNEAYIHNYSLSVSLNDRVHGWLPFIPLSFLWYIDVCFMFMSHKYCHFWWFFGYFLQTSPVLIACLVVVLHC